MKTLLLLRHAKSSWDQPGLADHDRPLAARGKHAAPRIGRGMAQLGLEPAAVLCSTALRARQTWAAVAQALGSTPRLEYRADLYHAGVDQLLGAVQSMDDAVDSVLIVGHNPGMEALANRLAGSGGKRARARMRRKYPTAGLAVLKFDSARWKDVGSTRGTGRLTHFITPADLPHSVDRRAL